MHPIKSRRSGHGKPVQVRLQKSLFEAIESWRRKQRTIPSRPEAIRRLLSRLLVEDTAAEPR
jgi:metal-responsive CopG/Arc/MetJ family transcriptional regulator